MWGWLDATCSAGLWMYVGFLVWLIICSLVAFRISKFAVQDRQRCSLTLSFLRGRVELETDPSIGPGTEHEDRVSELLAHRRDQAAS